MSSHSHRDEHDACQTRGERATIDYRHPGNIHRSLGINQHIGLASGPLAAGLVTETSEEDSP
jgi:hypothetical protein